MEKQVRVQLDLRIPMRDGVELYGAMYRPEDGERFPVLLIRSPYSTQHPRYIEWAMRFVESGYAVVMQDSRGRYESDGKWRPYIDEAQDGYDTQEWIGQQAWCDSTIGTFGISYPGFTQILPAPYRSRFVKALVPIANQEDNFGHLRYNGLLQQQNAMNWIWLGDRTNQNAPRELIDWDEVYRRLPLLTALDDIGDRPFYRDVIRNNEFNSFWSSYSMKGKYQQVETPAYFITGWYDNLVHEGFKCFAGWQTSNSEEVRRTTRLMVGPWTHSKIGSAEPFGDVDFGMNAAVDIPAEHVRWYDQRMRGKDTGIDKDPPVRIFVMGENIWRSESCWPLEQTEYTPFYLHSNGKANSVNGDGELSKERPGDEPADYFNYDPEDPIPTLGGQSMFPGNTGPRDRSALEERNDILVFTSPVLEDGMEVTGPLEVRLFAESDARDTDFAATLVDVHPGGAAIHITEGIVRARFRESFENSSLIDPGEIVEYRFALWETSNFFRPGHRIRLEISSSNFPRFDRNLNTGTTPGLDDKKQVARQTVYHREGYASHVLLPVIPR